MSDRRLPQGRVRAGGAAAPAALRLASDPRIRPRLDLDPVLDGVGGLGPVLRAELDARSDAPGLLRPDGLAPRDCDPEVDPRVRVPG